MARLTCEAIEVQCSDARAEKWHVQSSTIRQETTVCYSKTAHAIFPSRAGHSDSYCLACQPDQSKSHNAVRCANRIVR